MGSQLTTRRFFGNALSRLPLSTQFPVRRAEKEQIDAMCQKASITSIDSRLFIHGAVEEEKKRPPLPAQDDVAHVER